MSETKHHKHHKSLNKSLEVTIRDFVTATGKNKHIATVFDLEQWSAEQAKQPTHRCG